MIPIVLFDDGDMAYGKETCSGVPIPTNISVYGATEEVGWHQQWNSLGDILASSLNLDCVHINSNDRFANALDWCLNCKGRAICFCDYRLNGVEVTSADVIRVGDVAVSYTHLTLPTIYSV